MTNLKNKRKIAALNEYNHEEHPRSNQARDTIVARSQKVFIMQVSEESEGRVTKKLSQEFNWTERRILGALCRFDAFLLSPLAQGHSRSGPGTSQNTYKENRGTNEDGLQSDSYSETRISQSPSTQNSDPDNVYDSQEWSAQEERCWSLRLLTERQNILKSV